MYAGFLAAGRGTRAHRRRGRRRRPSAPASTCRWRATWCWHRRRPASIRGSSTSACTLAAATCGGSSDASDARPPPRSCSAATRSTASKPRPRAWPGAACRRDQLLDAALTLARRAASRPAAGHGPGQGHPRRHARRWPPRPTPSPSSSRPSAGRWPSRSSPNACKPYAPASVGTRAGSLGVVRRAQRSGLHHRTAPHGRSPPAASLRARAQRVGPPLPLVVGDAGGLDVPGRVGDALVAQLALEHPADGAAGQLGAELDVAGQGEVRAARRCTSGTAPPR